MCPTNVYFNHKVESEQNLFEDLIIESLGIYGQDVYYLPREILKKDDILNEDYSKFAASYIIEMYVANDEGFGGEGSLLTKFGLEIKDTATFIVAKKRFRQLVEIEQNEIVNIRPREGDLIYLPLAKALFEIKFVEHEKPFYQINQLPTYELQCELFQYNQEELNTGIEDIDDLEIAYGQNIAMEVEGGTLSFDKNDVIYQDIGSTIIRGTVASFVETLGENPRKGILYVIGTKADDGSGSSWVESIAPAGNIINETKADHDMWGINNIFEVGEEGLPTDDKSDNDTFEIDGDDIIDFSETNPFGGP